jgi:hypothetical protein
VATAAFFIALALPAGAFAGKGHKCNASACKVYVEQGGSPHPGAGSKRPQQSSTGPATNGGGSQTRAPGKSARALAHAGPERSALKNLLGDAGLGKAGADSGSIASPSALGAAFDVGSGPTVLLAILLATMIALAGHSGLRSWRRRRANP